MHRDRPSKRQWSMTNSNDKFHHRRTRMYKNLILMPLLALAFSAVTHAQQNPLIGTWKMNIAKSKFEGDNPPAVPVVAKFEMAKDQIKMATDAVNPQGQKTHTETVFKLDGKDYPLT